MTLSTECVDLFLLGCIPGASQAVPGSLPGWNNPNNPSWERLETFLSPIKQCLDDRLWSCQVEIILSRGTSQVYQYLTKMDPGEMSPENVLRRSWPWITQCLDYVCKSSVKLPGRNNFVTMNVPGIPIFYQDGPRWNVTWERLMTFLSPMCDQPIITQDFLPKLWSL